MSYIIQTISGTIKTGIEPATLETVVLTYLNYSESIGDGSRTRAYSVLVGNPPAKAAYPHPKADTKVPYRNTHPVFVLLIFLWKQQDSNLLSVKHLFYRQARLSNFVVLPFWSLDGLYQLSTNSQRPLAYMIRAFSNITERTKPSLWPSTTL